MCYTVSNKRRTTLSNTNECGTKLTLSSLQEQLHYIRENYDDWGSYLVCHYDDVNSGTVYQSVHSVLTTVEYESGELCSLNFQPNEEELPLNLSDLDDYLSELKLRYPHSWADAVVTLSKDETEDDETPVTYYATGSYVDDTEEEYVLVL